MYRSLLFHSQPDIYVIKTMKWSASLFMQKKKNIFVIQFEHQTAFIECVFLCFLSYQWSMQSQHQLLHHPGSPPHSTLSNPPSALPRLIKTSCLGQSPLTGHSSGCIFCTAVWHRRGSLHSYICFCVFCHSRPNCFSVQSLSIMEATVKIKSNNKSTENGNC